MIKQMFLAKVLHNGDDDNYTHKKTLQKFLSVQKFVDSIVVFVFFK